MQVLECSEDRQNLQNRARTSQFFPTKYINNLTGLGVAAKYLKIRTRPKSMRVLLRVLVQIMPFPCASVSIKRDVKKKLRLDRRSGFVSRDPAHFNFCFSGQVWLCCHSPEFLCPGDGAIEFERAASETGRFGGNHGSIRGSWPIAISGYPRGHTVR